MLGPILFVIFSIYAVILLIGHIHENSGARLALRWVGVAQIFICPNKHWACGMVLFAKYNSLLRLEPESQEFHRTIEEFVPDQKIYAQYLSFCYFLSKGNFEAALPMVEAWAEQARANMREKMDETYEFFEEYGADFSGLGQNSILEKMRSQRYDPKGYVAQIKAGMVDVQTMKPHRQFYEAQFALGVTHWILAQDGDILDHIKAVLRQVGQKNRDWRIHIHYDRELVLRLGMSETEIEAIHQSIIRRPEVATV